MVNAKAIAELEIPVLLLDTSYNQGELPKGVIRCDDWKGILEEIQKVLP
jgi:uncharacterized HAD superfamily protein